MARKLYFAALVPAVILSCMLTAVPARLSAQGSTTRLVHVTVTEPTGRFVVGLDRKYFEVVENGVRRTITDFSPNAGPVSFAIVAQAPSAAVSGFMAVGDDVIQTTSLPDALRQLSTSKNPRKALIVTTRASTRAIPNGIEVLRTDSANLRKAILEIHNRYLLQFESSAPSANVEVVLNPPSGLPVMRLSWN